MQLTRAVDYGLRALIVMSRKPMGTRFFLQELSERANLPRNYLVKVLKSLASDGIVCSHRGIKGGFTLGRAPEAISMRQVVEAIDGPVTLMHCLADVNSCPNVGLCAVEVTLDELRQYILQRLEAKSIRDLIVLQEKIENGTVRCGRQEEKPTLSRNA